MKLDIQDLKDRLDVLEGTTITSINEQISAINTSISDLKEMDESLDTYIKALEATATDLQKQINDANAEIAKVEAELGEEISVLEQTLLNELNTAKETIEAELLAINNTLAELKQADEALDKKISDIQAYVDTQLTSTTNWANATFSTLAQYEQTQTEMSTIKASIEQINAGVSALETRMNGKIASDIQTAIDALRIEVNADHASRIESSVNNLTVAYTAAISSARTEITTAYTNAISNAIIASESGMKVWVNSVLTQGYYDIATIDGKLSALSARLDETDTDLQKQITELKTSLETSKEELTKAYKSAITTAIEENNGVINASIAEAVQNLEDKIQARLTVIETNISNIQKQIANISKDITSIYEQIAGITSSLSDLQDVDKELQNLIANLETELADLLEEFESLKPVDEPTRQALLKEIEDLKALIQALQAKDVELQNQISALQTYIDTELQKIADWAEATFATLEQYSAMQAEISAIKTLIDKIKAEITEEYTAAIEAAISNSETSMKAWVNTLLAQGYYTISDIDGKVSALEALIADGDNNLQKQINEQKTALQQAKADLTNEYKQYINQAIASGGIIDQAIASQVKKAQDALQSKIDAINERLDALEGRLGKLEEDFVNRIQSLKYIPEYSDGKVMVSDIFRMKLTADFIVTPSSQAENIKNAWLTNKDFVKSYLRYTKSPETRAISPAIPLEVISIDVNEIGVLTISLAESVDNPIGDGHWYTDFEGIVYLQISDGNNDIISDYVKVETKYDNICEVRDPAIFTNLSVTQSSNCYIISEAGLYCFQTYKGNSNELAGAVSVSHPTGNPTLAEVLWESYGNDKTPNEGDLIRSIKYENNYIYFRTSETFSKGNSIIVLKDAAGSILWSWHIWNTDLPQEDVYRNNVGIMMDRNLGATDVTLGDVRAHGLMYQWGRKDPFVGYAAVTKNEKSTVSASTNSGTIVYSIQNPTVFIKDESDWCKEDIETRNNRWQDNNKTVYDPCPNGWRVPSSVIWNSYPYSNKSDFSSENGLRFGIANEEYTYYPKTGILASTTGSWVTTWGYSEYHSGTIGSKLYFRSYDVSTMYVPSGSLNSATGAAVRCQKE